MNARIIERMISLHNELLMELTEMMACSVAGISVMTPSVNIKRIK